MADTLCKGIAQGCHGENLTGAPPLLPGGPPVPNLTQSGQLGKWTEAGFVNTLRTGRTPEGKLQKDDMPWREFGKMNDIEIRAMWAYLSTLN